MKSDVIQIRKDGNGFEDAVAETKKAAAYRGLGVRDSLRLQLITEEILSMVLSITGEMEASFWIESEGKKFELHMSTQTVMDQKKRGLFISAATSRKNEASRTFLGFLRDTFEKAMLSDTDDSSEDLPQELLNDLPGGFTDAADWDGYERSVLRRTTDSIRVSVRRNVVDMTVLKTFA